MEKYREALEHWKEKAGPYVGKMDKDAFITCTLIKILEKQGESYNAVDLIPNSNIDEYIDMSKDCFVKYMEDKTSVNLDRYLKQTHQILSEVYHTVPTHEEKELFRNFVKNLNIICR